MNTRTVSKLQESPRFNLQWMRLPYDLVVETQGISLKRVSAGNDAHITPISRSSSLREVNVFFRASVTIRPVPAFISRINLESQKRTISWFEFNIISHHVCAPIDIKEVVSIPRYYELSFLTSEHWESILSSYDISIKLDIQKVALLTLTTSLNGFLHE